MSGLAVRQIAQQYARGELQGPLVLIGHSLGGDLLPGLAQQLDAAGQQVDLMVMIDSTNPSDAPRNVRRCVNMYQSNFSPTWFRVFRGVPIRADHADTQLVNVDIRQLPERDKAAKLNHFNIEASTWIHDIAMIVTEAQNEERYLRQVHGPSYDQYCRQTDRFLPWRYLTGSPRHPAA